MPIVYYQDPFSGTIHYRDDIESPPVAILGYHAKDVPTKYFGIF